MTTKNLILKLYSITITLILGFLILSGFTSNSTTPKEFKEITVERINVIEPDGKLKMVISNSKMQHPGMFDGETLEKRMRPPGIIFFNEEQDEVGGLTFHGNKEDGAGAVLSLDQYKNDQVMQMQYLRDLNGRQRYGMKIWDRSEKITLPELIHINDSLKARGFSKKAIKSKLEEINNGKPIASSRMFAGKNFDNQVGVFLKDEFGNDLIRIYVDENNEPKFQILNKRGEMVKELISE